MNVPMTNATISINKLAASAQYVYLMKMETQNIKICHTATENLFIPIGQLLGSIYIS